jgi:uncharacterized protein (DUF1499 family)
MPSEPTPQPAPKPPPRPIPRALLLSGLAAVATLPLLWWINASSTPKTPPGIHNGSLAPCPDSPNCASSQTDKPAARVEPLPFHGSAQESQARLKSLIASLPNTRLVQESPGYLHFEFRTRICRFVDDVEFLLADDARVIHVRSASRLGYSDLGTNRRRIEAIRNAWTSTPPPQP